ncbi:hypothetical protein BDA99DRAFT_567805 [Phascolomyces articulosus]|uniref:F-box domain-containing protein n=1 Tax=Phascolomyces articulosus TaxID=60185 RepID=A0AAD5PJK9_9FUNG|nr:hypothetical protein BDA99DRAFT_567805 [Phascolomyces articulosus]
MNTTPSSSADSASTSLPTSSTALERPSENEKRNKGKDNPLKTKDKSHMRDKVILRFLQNQILTKAKNWNVLSIFSPQQKQKKYDCQPMDINTKSSVLHQLLVPNEVLRLIFKHLAPLELIRCTVVCQAWYEFMVSWTFFWETLTHTYGHMFSASALDTFVRRRMNTLHVDQSKEEILFTAIQILINSHNSHSIQKLSISSTMVIHNHSYIDTHFQTLISSFPVKQIEFINIPFTSFKFMKHVLKICSMNNISHLSFYEDKELPDRCSPNSFNYKSFNKKKSFQYIYYLPNSQEMPAKGFPSLKYLRLASPIAFVYKSRKPITASMSQRQVLDVNFYKKCPNLVDLFLGIQLLPANNRLCIVNEIFNYCPQLSTLIVSPNAQMPWTCIDGTIKEKVKNECHHHGVSSASTYSSTFLPSNSQQEGLRKFVFTNQELSKYHRECINDVKELFSINHSVACSVLEKCHVTLELLYLRCYQLGLYQREQILPFYWPKLREIYLSFGIQCLGSNNDYPAIINSLVNLFKRCPVLEAITINPETDEKIPQNHRLYIDDKVLGSIAENCSIVRHLRVLGSSFYHQYTSKGILNFATIGGTQLKNLGMDIPPEIILLVAIKLKSLTNLELHQEVQSENRTSVSLPDTHSRALILLFDTRSDDNEFLV